MKRAEVLKKAEACVLVERQAAHGKPENTFGLIAVLWSGFLGITIKPHEVCALMGLLKIARSKVNPLNEDNWVDAAGYAACGSELVPPPVVQKSFWNEEPNLPLDFLFHGRGPVGLDGESPAPLPSSALPPHLRSDLPES